MTDHPSEADGHPVYPIRVPHSGPPIGPGELGFDQIYRLTLYRHFPTVPDGKSKEVLGTGTTPQACAFCGVSAPTASFTSESHAVPAGLGNRSLLSAEECDDCNQAFSICDMGLCEALDPARAFARTRRRRGGRPKFKPGAKGTIGGAASDGSMNVEVHKGDESLTVEPLGPGRVRIKFDHSYNPHAAMRSMARIAWFCLSPQERSGIPELKSFIDAGSPTRPYHAVWASIPGGLSGTHVTVWRSSEGAPDTAPPIVVQVIVGAHAIVWCLPSTGTEATQYVWPALPAFLPDNPPTGQVRSIRGDGRVTFRGVSVDLAYDSIVGTETDGTPISASEFPSLWTDDDEDENTETG